MINETGLLRRAAVAVALASVVLLGNGCGGGGSSSDLPSPSPGSSSTSGSPTASVDPDHLPILEAYENFVRAAATAANRGDPDYVELADYADGPAYVMVRVAIQEHADNGRVYAGAPIVVSTEVTHIDLDAAPEEPNASLAACVDIRDYVLVFVDDSSPVPVARGSERYVATVDLWYTADKRWLVIDIVEQREVPC